MSITLNSSSTKASMLNFYEEVVISFNEHYVAGTATNICLRVVESLKLYE